MHLSAPFPLLCVTGPTASGKTALGVALAERLGAEIISMDSMAVYRGMDIGTAKPSAGDRQRVPHHLVDTREPWQDYSLADYLRDAEQAASAIRARARLPLFVGGTPLYLKALLHGLAAGPAPDRELRTRLERAAASGGARALHERLGEIDPKAAVRIHPRDLRRIIRALEVFERTGTPISQYQVHFDRAAQRPARVLCLAIERSELYRRIDQRVLEMFQRGLVAEVDQLLQLHAGLSRTARQALGYKEVIDHLAGGPGLDQTIALVQRRTRQFAKRQLTWFRSIPQCRAVAADEVHDTAALAAFLAAN